MNLLDHTRSSSQDPVIEIPDTIAISKLLTMVVGIQGRTATYISYSPCEGKSCRVVTNFLIALPATLANWLALASDTMHLSANNSSRLDSPASRPPQLRVVSAQPRRLDASGRKTAFPRRRFLRQALSHVWCYVPRNTTRASTAFTP